jgi:hypothetical protein
VAVVQHTLPAILNALPEGLQFGGAVTGQGAAVADLDGHFSAMFDDDPNVEADEFPQLVDGVEIGRRDRFGTLQRLLGIAPQNLPEQLVLRADVVVEGSRLDVRAVADFGDRCGMKAFGGEQLYG